MKKRYTLELDEAVHAGAKAAAAKLRKTLSLFVESAIQAAVLKQQQKERK